MALGPLLVGLRHEVRVRHVVLHVRIGERRHWRCPSYSLWRSNIGEQLGVCSHGSQHASQRGEGAGGTPDVIPANLTRRPGRRPVQDDTLAAYSCYQPCRRIGGGAGRLLVLLVAAPSGIRGEAAAPSGIRGEAATPSQIRGEAAAPSQIRGVAAATGKSKPISSGARLTQIDIDPVIESLHIIECWRRGRIW